jgi:hypothetical protein
LPEGRGKAAGGGRQAPERYARSDDCAAAEQIGGAGKGNTQKNVEENERGPGQQAELHITDGKVVLDRSDQENQKKAIDIRAYRGECQEQHTVPRTVSGRPCRFGP